MGKQILKEGGESTVLLTVVKEESIVSGI